MKKIIFIIIVVILVYSFLNGWGLRDRKLNFIEDTNYIVVFEFTTNSDLGIQFIRSVAHKPGFFVHFQCHLGSPPEECVYGSITPYIAEEIYGDWYRGDDKHSILYAAGVSLAMSPSTLFCLGMGVAQQIQYRNYMDFTGILGDGGSYYVIEKDEWGISPYLAINFKVSRFMVCAFSLSTYPFQVGFGLGADFGLMGM